MLCIFVSKEYIYRINSKYRKKHSPTDVITFSYANITIKSDANNFQIESLQLDYSLLLGEIYICYEVAKKQSKEKNITVLKEMITLLIHGIFHAFGLDHENSKKEEEFMQTQERFFLKELNRYNSFSNTKTNSF